MSFKRFWEFLPPSLGTGVQCAVYLHIFLPCVYWYLFCTKMIFNIRNYSMSNSILNASHVDTSIPAERHSSTETFPASYCEGPMSYSTWFSSVRPGKLLWATYASIHILLDSPYTDIIPLFDAMATWASANKWRKKWNLLWIAVVSLVFWNRELAENYLTFLCDGGGFSFRNAFLQIFFASKNNSPFPFY